MKHLIFTLGILFAIRVDAAMVRVVDVQDGRTLVIERNGSRETVRLAGITVTDETRAAELLRWTVVSFWVLVEPDAGGGHFAFRSPDALFVNRELVLRGYARATAHGIEPERNLVVTYLGTIDPPAVPTAASAPRTSSGTRRRSTASRAPKTPRAERPADAPKNRAAAPRRR
jgi:hypothetical protein